jgi:hypothetical protein
MLFNRNSVIQSASRRFCTIYKSKNSVPCQPFVRRDISSRRPTVQSIIRQDDENFMSGPSSVSRSFSSLHPFRRLSVFDKLQGFFPKHSYGKIAATVRTKWISVRTCSSIRQVSHSKSRRPDVSPLGPDAHASDMEIACIKSTVRTTIPLVRMREALVWKLLAAEVRPFGRCSDDRAPPSGRSSNQERILAKFSESRSHSCLSGRPITTVRTEPRFYQVRCSF